MNSPLKWHGGKHYLADWIVSNFPSRDTWNLYREPFAGGLSVLLRLDPEGLGEAVNDIYRELYNFWRVLAYTPEDMFRRLWNTPFSQDAWNTAMMQRSSGCDIEAATAFFISARQSRQSLMQCFATPSTRIRRGMAENVSAWLASVEGLADVHQRLRRVEVRCLEASEFIRKYDSPRALFYCDPPYLQSTRTSFNNYTHEMTDTQHAALLEVLSKIQGKFVLSGYPSEMYDEFAKNRGWRRVTKVIDNKASSGTTKPFKIEVLWMNY